MEVKSWLSLLIMAGFETVEHEEDTYELVIHTKEDCNYFWQLFTDANISYFECKDKCGPSIDNRYRDSYLICYSIKITEPPIQTDLWKKLIIDANQGGYESGTDQDTLPLICVEPHVRAIFSQFRRFGLHMVESCEGHEKGRQTPNRYPHFIFYNLNHAQIARKLICNIGFKAQLINPDYLRIDESKENLMALGLKLSELRNIEDYYFQEMLEKEKRLIKLLSIPGQSGHEELVANAILDQLSNISGTISYVVDGNIQGELKKGTEKSILLSAHMDVYADFAPDSSILKRGNCLYRLGSILGADDRAGIALILDVLQFFSKTKNGYSIKYLFTASEERPPHGVENVDPTFFENVEFALSFDRKGCKDIVYKHGSIVYGSPEFAEKISRISRDLFGIKDAFSPCEGGISDLRFWSERGVESVNLSIGYLDEHTPKESLDLCCWNRTYELVLRILESEYELFTHRLFQQRLNKHKP